MIGLAVLGVLAVIPVLLHTSVGVLASWVADTWARFKGWLKLKIALFFARRSLPQLIKKAAFGADAGTFVALSEKPPGCPVLESIPQELADQATTRSRQVAAEGGQILLRAAATQDLDIFAIKTNVREAFENVALVHSMYYGATTLKERIAQLVARPAGDEPLPLMPLFARLGSVSALPLFDWHRWRSSNASDAAKSVIANGASPMRPTWVRMAFPQAIRSDQDGGPAAGTEGASRPHAGDGESPGTAGTTENSGGLIPGPSAQSSER
jgi:hypothetical protein